MGEPIPDQMGAPIPHRRRTALAAVRRVAAVAAFALIAATAAAAVPSAPHVPSPPHWRRCAAGAGGALDVSVRGLSCGDARTITENGLDPSARRTRVGGLTCRRRRDPQHGWAYMCRRPRGPREGLSFDTY